MTSAVVEPGSGLLLSALTANTLSPEASIASVASSLKRANAPAWRPSGRPFNQTSAIAPTPSNSRKYRLPRGARCGLKCSRYQPMPCTTFVRDERCVPSFPTRFQVCGTSTRAHCESSNPVVCGPCPASLFDRSRARLNRQPVLSDISTRGPPVSRAPGAPAALVAPPAGW